MEAVIVMAKCASTKGSFGIRTQKVSDYWVMNWAFKINDKTAVHEGYDRQTVSGVIKLADTYPGCPYCGNTAWVKCGKCGKLTCFNASGTVQYRCAYCGNSGDTYLDNEFTLESDQF